MVTLIYLDPDSSSTVNYWIVELTGPCLSNVKGLINKDIYDNINCAHIHSYLHRMLP